MSLRTSDKLLAELEKFALFTLFINVQIKPGGVPGVTDVVPPSRSRAPGRITGWCGAQRPPRAPTAPPAREAPGERRPCGPAPCPATSHHQRGHRDPAPAHGTSAPPFLGTNNRSARASAQSFGSRREHCAAGSFITAETLCCSGPELRA